MKCDAAQEKASYTFHGALWKNTGNPVSCNLTVENVQFNKLKCR